MSSASAWLRMARVSNTPTTVSDTVAGSVLVAPAAAAGPVAVVAVAIALFYTAGMILTDVMDLAIDRRERPERPLPSGEVSVQAAVVAVVLLFVVGELLLLLEGWEGAAALMLVYVVGLTQVAKAEGSGIAARWPVIAVLLPAVYWCKELPDAAVAVLLVVFVAWAVYALWLVLARHRIGAGVVSLIAGIALYDALVTAGADGSGVAVAVCLAAFAVTIALQTKIQGT